MEIVRLIDHFRLIIRCLLVYVYVYARVCVCMCVVQYILYARYRSSFCVMHNCLFENLYLLQTFTQRTIDLTQSVEFSRLNCGKFCSKKHEKLLTHCVSLIFNLATVFYTCCSFLSNLFHSSLADLRPLITITNIQDSENSCAKLSTLLKA